MGGTREVWIAATALAAVLAAQEAAAQNKSGVVAVKLAGVDARMPGGKLTPINIGDAVFANQVIRTGPRGRAKINMIDRSALLIGPNSEITIESFEFDREEGLGSMTIEAAKGLFRFVGGLVSKRHPVQIRTSYGTIGIRGAVVLIAMNDDGSIDVYFLYGDEASFQSNSGDSEQISKPGYKLHVDASGNVSVVEASQEELDNVQKTLESPDGGGAAPARTLTINDATPEMMEVTESEISALEQRLEDLDNESGANFDAVQEVVEQLGLSAGGSGG